MIYNTIATLIAIPCKDSKGNPCDWEEFTTVMGILESSFTAVVVPCTVTTDDSWSCAASLIPSDMPDGLGNADSV